MKFTVVAIGPDGKSRNVRIMTFHVEANTSVHAIVRVNESGMRVNAIACFPGEHKDDLAQEIVRL